MCTRSLFLSTIALAILADACTHKMHVTNLRDHQLDSNYSGRRDIAILPYEGEPEGRAFFEHAVEALRAHPSVGQFRTNWSADRLEPGFDPEAVLKITPHVEYEGWGWNLPITVPGFLVFAHALNGVGALSALPARRTTLRGTHLLPIRPVVYARQSIARVRIHRLS